MKKLTVDNLCRNSLIISAIFMALTGCKEDEPAITPDPLPVVGQELELSRTSDIIDIEVPEGEAWELTRCPEWIGVKGNAGEGGTAVNMFIEDNIFDEDRVDTLAITTASGKHFIYPLRQMGLLSDPDNGQLGDGDIKLTYGVGMGVNVLTNSSGGKYDIRYAAINNNKIGNLLKNAGEGDAFWEDNNYISSTNSYSGTTTSSIANQLAVEAGIGVELSAFEVKLSGAFETKTSSSMKSQYAMRNINHQVKSRYLREGAVRHMAKGDGYECLASGIRTIIDNIKNGDNPQQQMRRLIENYGTHVITYAALGGSLQFSVSHISTEEISDQEIRAALDVSVKSAVSVSGSFEMTDKEKKTMENTTVSFVSYGGESFKPMAAGTSFEDAVKHFLSKDVIDQWVAPIKKNYNKIALIDMKAVPIWDLIPDKEVAEQIHEYVVNSYQTELTKHEPLIYVVDGLDANDDVDQGFAELPEINVRLEYYDAVVPAIDSRKTVRVVYSGTMDKMDYAHGFCIGGNGIKPGKLRRDRNGKYNYEPFEDLTADRITAVYVDMSGDVTIAPKSTINYKQRRFSVGGILAFVHNGACDFRHFDNISQPYLNWMMKEHNVGIWYQTPEFWDENNEWPLNTNYVWPDNPDKLPNKDFAVSRTPMWSDEITEYSKKHPMKVRVTGQTGRDFKLYSSRFLFFTRNGELLSELPEDLSGENVPFDFLIDVPSGTASLCAENYINGRWGAAINYWQVNIGMWLYQQPPTLTFYPEYKPNPLK